MFVLPTRPADLADTTPTPIATPELLRSAMGLHILSEEEALALIDEMNEYAYQNFPPFDSWSVEGDFIAAQESVALAIQEYLYHFPDSLNADRLRWQLALINSVMYNGLAGNQYGDDWMIRELEKRLNQGETAPDQLENILGKYWFEVTYVQPMKNLFGDGTTGWLYQIAPRLWEEGKRTVNQSFSEGSMFFVVREAGKGQFKIYFLNSAWNLSFGDSYVFDTVDHNRNGIPEVALYIGGHSGTMCEGNLFIYEWKDNNFSELTKGHLPLHDCSEDFEYSSTLDGIPTINFSGIFPIRREQYIWNGDSYEFSQYFGIPPLEVWWNAVGTRLSYEEEEKLLNEILASNEVPDNSAAFSDYLRYRLGTVYAFDLKGDQAIHELQNLISSPRDPTRKIFPDMAKKFLERYKKDEASLYDACHQSRLIYDRAFDATRDSSGPAEDEKFQGMFGFPFDPLSFGYVPCDEDKAFHLAVQSISATVQNVPAELRKMGVNLDYSQKIDANLDGKTDEWLVRFDPDRYFLVFPDGSQYRAEELDTSIGDASPAHSSVLVNVQSWSNLHNPVMILRVGHEFDVLEIEKNYASKSLFSDFDVLDYSISVQDGLPQLQVFYSTPTPDSYYPDHPWSGYRWDAGDNEFKDDLLEYTLFVLRNPQKAAEISGKLFPFLAKWKNTPDISAWSLPYTYYLVGLSYELSGDQQRAAQVYWQLWRDFPDSQYARMARYKLEPSNP